MRHALAVVASTVLASVLALAVPAAAAPAEVTFDQSRVTARLGDRFTLESRVTNTGATVAPAYIAHLNVASMTDDVYVDPEDWSASRSMRVRSLRPGASVALSWEIQAVNAGTFDIYVVLLPGDPRAPAGPLVVSPPVRANVAARQTLNAGGALPVVVVVPILLGLAAAGTRIRLRRTR